MATDRPRIQGYTDPAVYDFFLKFQKERGLRESSALNQILREYFGFSDASSSLEPTQIEKLIQAECEMWAGKIGQRLTALEKKISALEPENHLESLGRLEERFAVLEKRIEALEPEAHESSIESEAIQPETQEEIEYSELAGNSSSELPKSLNGSELGRRLRVAKSAISSRKSRADFEEWSKGKDPDGIAWRYDAKSLQFFPVEAL